MAKKSSKGFGVDKVVALVAFLLGAVALVLFGVLPMVKSVVEETLLTKEIVTNYSGFAMIFGGQPSVVMNGEALDSRLVGELDFNFMAFLAFLLVAVGALLGAVTPFVKQLKSNKLFALVAGLLMVVGAVLMFTVEGSVATVMAGEDGNVERVKEMIELASGPIVAGILALVGGLVNLANPFLKK